MGILQALLGGELREQPGPADDYWYQPFAAATAAGARVDADTALTLSAVYCAVRIYAESVAQLPLILYRRLASGGKERATDHPLYALVGRRPNKEQTAFEYREMLQGHLGLRGNAYARIIRDNAGRPLELIPLHPARMTPKRLGDKRDGDLVYEYRLGANPPVIFRREQIHHLRGLSSDGVLGLSPVTLAREGLGRTLQMEKHAAKLFSNGTRLSGVLEHPTKLSDVANKRLRDSWESMHAGADNAHRTAILEEGLKWHEVSMTAEDAQFIQSRKFETIEIARWFNLPPHMLKDLERASFANIEHQALEFVQYSLLPWLERWEQALARDLLPEPEQETFFFEFLVDAFLRGDYLTRQQGLAIQRQNGVINADDWREKENMNPLPDEQGKVYLLPLNMIPADRADEMGPQAKPSSGVGSVAGDSTARARLRAAFRHVFHDAAARLVRKEIAAARRAAKKAETWPTWLAEFYGEHQADVERALLPAIRGYGEACGIGDGVLESYASALALRYATEGRRELEALGAEGAEAALARWEEARAEAIATRAVDALEAGMIVFEEGRA